MNAFPTDAHLHITVEPRLTRHLSQTIQTVELLELNAEGLYEYLAQAAEANPMMLVQRTPLPELPLHARCEGFDVGDLGMHDEQELGAYLRRQLAFLKLRKEKARIAAYLVESLDENGFFREDCASAARELGVSEAAVKDALEAVQSLEPAGIGARSLQECLLLQLRRLPQRNALAEKIVGMHWELFLRRPRAGMLADFLDMESSQIVTMHIQSVDQTAAIKTIKRTITELDRSKIEEQKKAVRSGYDMDIIPSDLATYGKDAKALLKE